MYRNVWLNILMMLSWLVCETTLAILLPNYLVDALHLTTTQMIFVMTAFGIGATLGIIGFNAISDLVGRKPVVFSGGICCLVLTLILGAASAHPATLFWLVLLVTFCSQGLISIVTGPLAVESVPATLMTTSSGVCIGIGEIIGGGCVPIISGFVAKQYGIHSIFTFCAFGLAVGILASIFVKETAPRKVAKMLANI
jgi:MFS family permease